MTAILWILFIAAIGTTLAGVAIHKKTESPGSKLMAIIGGVSVLGILFSMAKHDPDLSLVEKARLDAHNEREARCQALGKTLAPVVARECKGMKVLIIRAATDYLATRVVATMKDSLLGAVDVSSEFLLGPPCDPKTAATLQSAPCDFMATPPMMTTKDVEQALQQHPGTQLIISFAGIPAVVDKAGVMTGEYTCMPGHKVTWISACRIMPQKADLVSGRILAWITYRPDAVAGAKAGPAPTDPKAIFEKYYVLVDKSNLATAQSMFPGMK